MRGNKPSLLDWLLYFGSRDERHRRAADRAGHLAFYIAVAAVALDMVIQASAPKADPLEALWSLRLHLAVLVAGGFYTLQWVKNGITLSDSPRQRRMLRWAAPITGLLVSGLLLWQWHQKLGWGPAALTGLAGGLAAWGLCWITFRWLDKAASKRLEKGAVVPD